MVQKTRIFFPSVGFPNEEILEVIAYNNAKGYQKKVIANSCHEVKTFTSFSAAGLFIFQTVFSIFYIKK